MGSKGRSQFSHLIDEIKKVNDEGFVAPHEKYSNSKIARIVGRNNNVSEKKIQSLRKFVATVLDPQLQRLEEESVNAGLNANDVKHAWIKDDNASLFVKNPNFKEADREEMFRELVESLQEYSPKFPKLKRIKDEDSYCLVVDPADLHVGKLALEMETGEEYNCQIAVQRTLDGVRGILNKAKGFKIEQIVFVGGNDILHTDNPRRTTTSGTPQDTDGMWYQNFLIAKQLYVDVLEILIGVADVHFVFNPSNHDYTNGFFLATVIQTYFRKCKNITFDCSIAHRKYFRYHDNLIGTTHGDGAKQADLPLLMAHECKDWSETSHRYIYTHHVHHKTAKDFIGVTVESLRSPSGTDSWHSRNGYTGAVKAVEGFIHCKKNGQIARLTHIFK